MADEEKTGQTLEYGQGKPKSLRMAISSATFGILSIPLMAFMFIGVVPAVAAVGMGIAALGRIRRNPELGGKVSALIGVICGGLALLLGTLCAASLAGMGR
jgi:hypothetical protein